MHVHLSLKFYAVPVLLCALIIVSCSKKDTPPAPPIITDACAGKTIAVTTTQADATPCSNNGSITALATGSTGFTYKLNSTGTYQASGTFDKVVAGAYTVFAKDAAGCVQSVAVTIASAGTAGADFALVKKLVAAKCQSCHNAGNANGGMNFDVECNIIVNEARIKVRAVDLGTMPQTGPLSQSDKDIISNWISAGGGYSN